MLVAVGLVVLPPALLFAVELAVGAIDARARAWLHLGLVATLCFLLVAYTVRKQLVPGSHSAVFPIAVAAAFAATAVYWRFAGVRSFVTILSVAPAVFLVVFLLGSSASKVIFPTAVAAVRSGAAPTPVVMIVFDEFPISSLMTPDGRIPAKRYPNFAALARTATWYRNAVTVHDYTRWAVPAIDSGRPSARKSSPVAADHRQTLFELLGGSHALAVFEGTERLCPKNLCAQRGPGSFPGRIPPLLGASTQIYLTLALPRRFTLDIHPPAVPEQDLDSDVARLVAALGRRTAKPRFAYLHVQAPHAPFRYLPSGRRYLDPPVQEAAQPGETVANRVLSDTYLERHLAQVAYTDRLLGRILAALRRSGQLDESLVVVTADHGISFQPGQRAGEHRDATPAIAPDILGVPLFVKAPGQRRGRVDSSYARTIDIAPTIAAMLHARPPRPFGGRPLGGSRALPARLTIEPQRGPPVTISTASFLRGRAAQAARVDRLLRAGPLVGTALRAVRVRPVRSPSVKLDDADAFRSVDLGGEVPALVSGEVTGAGARFVKSVAVAIDGRIAATAPTYASRGQLRFAAFTGDRWLRPGRNDVTVLAIPPAKAAPLVRLDQ